MTDHPPTTGSRAAIPQEHLCPYCNVRRKMTEKSATCGMLRCVLRMRRAEEADDPEQHATPDRAAAADVQYRAAMILAAWTQTGTVALDDPHAALDKALAAAARAS